MKETIRPKDKTRKLRDATLELMRRNDKVRECFEKIVSEKKSEIPRELLETALVPNAVAGFRFCNGKTDPGRMYYHPREGCDLEKVLTLLHGNKPNDTLIVGVDLTRPKDSILAEISSLLDMQLNRTGHREKWLPIVDELLQVWDLYEAAGKTPAIQSFRNISRKLGRPLSTVKDQWYAAYEKIYRKRYDPDSKFATEETKRLAEEKVCRTCPHLKGKSAPCQKNEFVPCAEYIRIAGRERNPTTAEYRDAMLYDERWADDLE